MYLPSFSLTGKTAMITGAGRGIGRALAIGFAKAGADVILVSRTQKDLDEVAGVVQELGRKAYTYAVDVAQKQEIQSLYHSLDTDSIPLHILVNNAGMNIRSKALDVTEEEWETIINTNLRSAFYFSQEAGKRMKEAGYGRILNISSVGGHVALRTGVVYASTKAALIQMTKNLALEWGRYGINVNAIGPWYFKTPLTEKLLADETYLNDILSRTPLNRVGELQELVGPAVFFASDAGSYCTGQTLFVDGGMTVYGF